MAENNKNKSVVVVGGGIMGLGTAFHLSERGYRVTLLEKQKDVAKVASYINGAMICPSMTASWASLSLLSKNKGELRRIQLSRDVVTDHKFWRWGLWFTYNCLWPGKVQQNDAAQQQLGLYSLKCLQNLEEIYGEKLAHNKTASNTLRLYYAEEDLKDFFKSSQAKFWEKNGHPFVKLSPGEIKEMLPSLDQQNLETCHPSGRSLVGGVINKPAIDSSGDIHEFCQNLKKLCLKNDVTIKTDTGVKEILTEGYGKNRVISGVLCQNGQIETGDIYVLAAGIMVNPLGRTIGVNLPIYPLKGNVVTVPLKKPMEFNVYSPDHGSLICPLEPNLGRISGGVQAVGYNWNYDEAEVLKSKVLDTTANLYQADYINKDLAQNYAALRPVSADDIPLIGRTIISNLYTNTGHGSKGWTLSFGSCQLLADIIDQKATKIDASPYSPLRFHPIKSRLFTLF